MLSGGSDNTPVAVVHVARKEAVVVAAVLVGDGDSAYSATHCSGDDDGGAFSVN